MQTISEYLTNRHSQGTSNELFPDADWQYEVDNGDTTLGLRDWRESQISMEADQAFDAVVTLISDLSAFAAGTINKRSLAQRIQDAFQTLRFSQATAKLKSDQILGQEAEEEIFGETYRSLPQEVADILNSASLAALEADAGSVAANAAHQAASGVLKVIKAEE